MLDWEEGLFKGILKMSRALWTGPREQPFREAAVELKTERNMLFLLAHALAGHRVSFFETDEPLLRRGRRICLPPSCSLFTDPRMNRDFYLHKVVTAALSLARDDSGKPEPTDAGSRQALWMEQARRLRPDFSWDGHFGKIERESETLKLPATADALPDGRGESESRPSPQRTEVEGKGQLDVEVLGERDLESPDIPEHVFEKIETLESFEGLDRPVDGSDELRDHEEALKELNLKHVYRSPDRASSVYRADILLSDFALEVAPAEKTEGIPYPEWDFRRRQYRENWCRVIPVVKSDMDVAWHRRTLKQRESQIQELKRRLRRFATERRRLTRQPEGDNFDLEALIHSRIESFIGGIPDELVFESRHNAECNLSTLVLMDLSDSTDAWIRNHHVLEVMKTALVVLGETLDAFTHEFSLAGFASKTRNSCFYFNIKDFSDEWRHAAQSLGALQPQGYSRMGPTLRHAAALLKSRPTRRKALIVLSDGKPCDYDRYEGQYGIQDVKRAIREAEQEGIFTYAFAIDGRAREHFPEMFSMKRFEVVNDPDQLVEAIFRLFLRLWREN